MVSKHKEDIAMDKLNQTLTADLIQCYAVYLQEQERSAHTIEKYCHILSVLETYFSGQPLTKSALIAWKACLQEKYAAKSVNTMLVAVNGFLRFIGQGSNCLKLLKIQRQIFIPVERELTKEEYLRLLQAAGNTRISFVLQTICGTGIRVSELQHITTEAILQGRVVVNCKNKTRVIFIPTSLQRTLLQYVKRNGIVKGPIFQTKSGKPLHRSQIWREMKKLCQQANVAAGKVFPHNLRHLFARTFYAIEKDIVRLADVLGHTSVDTTRIYTIEAGAEHRRSIEKTQKLLMAT
jgi:integrase/recombinase XerD